MADALDNRLESAPVALPGGKGYNAAQNRAAERNGTLCASLSQRTLRDFWERHPDAEAALDAWYRETEQARWHTPADVRARYPNASIIGGNRAVFRIKGNAYRLVAQINYDAGRVYIRFIGAHSEYNRINAAEV